MNQIILSFNLITWIMFVSAEVHKSLSLCSIFMHLCFCKRSCDDANDKKHCTLCSKDKVLFKEILIDWRGFNQKLLHFTRDHSFVYLSIFWNSNRWLTKFKKHKREEFYRIKQPFKFFKMLLDIIVRICLNKLLQVLHKVVSHHEYNFITQPICWQAYDLMIEVCCETNVDFFNRLLLKMSFMKNYFSDCFFIQNNSPDYIDLTKWVLLEKCYTFWK